jgi:hypothetical protein
MTRLETAARMTATVAMVALAGCATNPATGLQSTGQALGVQTESEHFAYQQQQKVAEVQYHDSAGRPAGSAGVYQTQTVHGTKIHWRPTQGTAVIDDQDFFRIAGDTGSEQEVEEYRRQGKAMNTVGWGLTLLGAGGIGATEAFMDTSQGRGRTIGGVAALSLIVGALWVYAGHYRVQPDHHAVELGKAREAAKRYNESLKMEAPAAP